MRECARRMSVDVSAPHHTTTDRSEQMAKGGADGAVAAGNGSKVWRLPRAQLAKQPSCAAEARPEHDQHSFGHTMPAAAGGCLQRCLRSWGWRAPAHGLNTEWAKVGKKLGKRFFAEIKCVLAEIQTLTHTHSPAVVMRRYDGERVQVHWDGKNFTYFRHTLALRARKPTAS